MIHGFQTLRKSLASLIGATLIIFAVTTTAQAVPVVILGPTNTGITSLSFSVSGTTITINEVWGAAGSGVLQFSGLDANVSYTVIKQITNNTGTGWTRLANELLDPAGQPNDNIDPQPYPAFVPLGFTTSNDSDGLSFAQGSGIPRVSSVFASVVADEFSDARDFLDFFNGTAPSGGPVFTVQFGLLDQAFTVNQPFLLVQRPNVDSRGPIPEPATILLLSTGLAGVGAAVRKRRKANKREEA